jgi:hypothetical protein
MKQTPVRKETNFHEISFQQGMMLKGYRKAPARSRGRRK